MSSEQSPTEQPLKKAKVPRSKAACVRCHSRRSKCGVPPPGPCPRCLRLGLECRWPTEEERGKRGRPSKRRESQIEALALVEETSGAASSSSPSSAPLSGLSALPVDQPLPPPPPPPPETDPFQLFDMAFIPPPPSNVSPEAPEHMAEWWWPFGTTDIPGWSVGWSGGGDTTTAARPLELQTNLADVSYDLVRHLFDLFFDNFGSQVPFLSRQEVETMLSSGQMHPLLLNAIMALAARFSTHGEVALPHLEPHAYGTVFLDRALSLLGPSVGLASRYDVSALYLLALAALGEESELRFLMLTSLAINLCLEMGLHRKPPDHLPDEDRRLNKLLFWSVLMLDYTVSFSQGRGTVIRPEQVSQSLPGQDDFMGPAEPRSPFPYAAQTIFALGPIVNLLSDARESRHMSEAAKHELRAACSRSAAQYDELPVDMMWNNANLKIHYRSGTGPMFISVHLWNHASQAIRSLTDSRLTSDAYLPSGKIIEEITPMSIQAGSWLHCARYIGDILVVADVVNPNIYLAVPLVSQCFFSAACCFAKDLESLTPSAPHSRKVFATLAMELIATLKQGLAKQSRYWAGVRRVEDKFNSRLLSIRGLEELGLADKLHRVLSFPAGVEDVSSLLNELFRGVS